MQYRIEKDWCHLQCYKDYMHVCTSVSIEITFLKQFDSNLMNKRKRGKK